MSTTVEIGVGQITNIDDELFDEERGVCHIIPKIGANKTLCGEYAVLGFFLTDKHLYPPEKVGMIFCPYCPQRRCPQCAEIYIREYGNKHDHSA